MLTLLFDGIAYGMLLFVLAVGLAVTLGLMNFINLAHGAFAMAGGYVLVALMQRAGWPFLACLPAAFVVTALLAAMKGQIFESPRGQILIDAQTRDIVQDIYIRKVEKKDGQLYNIEFDVQKAVKDPGKAK